jgi:hypothetical protein
VKVIHFFVPVKTVSEANAHEHWRVRQKRAKHHRWSARFAAEHASIAPKEYPITVRMTRVCARKLDSDNLSGSCKHVRDGIADWLGVDDGRDDLVTWEYAQSIGKIVGVEVSASFKGTP